MSLDQPEPDSAAEETDPLSGAVRFSDPSGQAAPTVALCFAWRGTETEVSGDISRGEAGLAITRAEVNGSLPAGITHQLLRKVPLGEILTLGRAHLAAREAPQSSPPAPETLPPGRILMTPDLLRRVAQAYIEETGPGKDRAVLQRLEARFGRPKGTLRTWIAKAREEGWLGPGVQGRGGAEPGPKLSEWQLNEFKRVHPGWIEHVQVSRSDGTVTDVSVPPEE